MSARLTRVLPLPLAGAAIRQGMGWGDRLGAADQLGSSLAARAAAVASSGLVLS